MIEVIDKRDWKPSRVIDKDRKVVAIWKQLDANNKRSDHAVYLNEFRENDPFPFDCLNSWGSRNTPHPKLKTLGKREVFKR